MENETRIKSGLISVIMSNYNTPELFLTAAIESVLSQTYKNFEFIIIDDCSTDDSLKIIESYSDERIKILKNERNLGITKSLNRGLKIASGEYIARMDSDDICYPQRFERQIEFLRSNPGYIVCGTGIEQIDEWGNLRINKQQCRDIPEREEYQIYLLFANNPNIVHPTAMFNHGLLIENQITYDENYVLAQDYRMWVTCSEYAECGNVPEILLKYRVHSKAVSNERREKQRLFALNNIKEQLKKLSIELPKEYEHIHENFLFSRCPYSIEYKKWIMLIIKQNQKYHVYNQKKLEQILWRKWVEISYFEIRTQKNLLKLIKCIAEIPISYMGQLLLIKKERYEKFRESN